MAGMSDIVKPSVQAFLVCDQVIEDSVTKKKSLIGLFTHLQAVSFPFQHSQMGLYFCLTDAEGTYHFDIDLTYLNSEQLVCRATLPNIVIGDRLQISDFGINIPFPDLPHSWAVRVSPTHGRTSHRAERFQCDADADPSNRVVGSFHYPSSSD